MDKIQKISNFIKSDLGFLLVLLIIITGTFCLLSPKISSQLFPFKRQAILTQFINSSKTNGINPQEYWKFREFYSPGYFTFSRTGIEKSRLLQTQRKIGIKYAETNIDLTFLVFSSPHVNSIDMLTKQTNLSSIVALEQLEKGKIIFKNDNSLIYQSDPKTIKIIFLLGNAQMKKANGFFDYTEKDKNLTAGENWFNVTTVSIY